uniref:Uncharacterized protein n=1 Tax=Cucumis melo TaxID=3656 RepID=A0A9I9E6R8_CUCME
MQNKRQPATKTPTATHNTLTPTHCNSQYFDSNGDPRIENVVGSTFLFEAKFIQGDGKGRGKLASDKEGSVTCHMGTQFCFRVYVSVFQFATDQYVLGAPSGRRRPDSVPTGAHVARVWERASEGKGRGKLASDREGTVTCHMATQFCFRVYNPKDRDLQEALVKALGLGQGGTKHQSGSINSSHII